MRHAKIIGALCASLFVLSACGATPGAGGRDADRRVMIINETGQTFQKFYGSRATTDSWEENILAGRTLRSGQRIIIDFDDGSDDCIFDLKAEFKGREPMVKAGIDVCRIEAVTFSK